MYRYPHPKMETSTADTDLLGAFKALANPLRLQILCWLRDPEAHFPAQDTPASEVGVCVKQIQLKAGVSQSTASAFLATLERAGFVRSQRIGQWTYYARVPERVDALAGVMRAELSGSPSDA
jgi:ArsR family transcriptional regulator